MSLGDVNKRIDKMDSRIDGLSASFDARLNKLWDVMNDRINRLDTKVTEAREQSSANFQKIIVLALMGLGSLLIALVEVWSHHVG